jgi:hypothetical protein
VPQPQQPWTVPEESCRATIAARTPTGDKCTVIAVRWGYGRAALLALSSHGVRETTGILDAIIAAELLRGLVHAAPLTTADRHTMLASIV